MSDAFLPFSREAERAILGCVFVQPECIKDILQSGLDPLWFYEGDHQRIWNNLVKLHNLDKAIDSVSYTLAWGYDALIPELDKAVPHILNLPVWVAELKALFQRRTAIQCATAVQRVATLGNEEPEKALEETYAIIRKLHLAQFGDLQRTFIEDEGPIDAFDLCNMELEPDPLVIEGFLRRKAILQVTGGAKSYKSWSLLNLAVLLSQRNGGLWMGMPVCRGRVLYINFELTKYDMKKRICDVSKELGIDFTKPEFKQWFKVWNRKGVNEPADQFLQKVIRKCRNENYALIIIDPIYKIYGPDMDENSAVEVGELLNQIERVATLTGAAVAYVHHFAKGDQSGKDAMDRGSGSGVFKRFCDAMTVITELDTENEFRADCINRSFPPIATIGLKWEAPLFRVDETVDVHKIKKPGARKKTSMESFLACIPDTGCTSKELKEICGNKLSISDRSVQRALKDAEERGQVVHQNGMYFRFQIVNDDGTPMFPSKKDKKPRQN